jgi:autotransporter-associated beta strand protein
MVAALVTLHARKAFHHFACLAALSVLGIVGLPAKHAQAATRYFDVNSTTTGSGVAAGGSYSWESNFWNANNTGGTGATTAWTEGDVPIFSAGTDGAGKTYTITASSNHTVAGMQLNTSGGTVNINGPGIFSLPAGDQGFSVGTPTSQNLNINATLGGTGRLAWQGTGSLFLLGNNNFSGGVLFSTSSGLNFTNDNSFGTGTMTWGATQQLLAAPTATVPINIGNPMVTRSASTMVMSSFAKPVTFSGDWTLATGTSTLDVRANADATIAGNISGTNSTSALTKISPGKLTLSGANTYAGGTTVSAGMLELSGASSKTGTGNVTITGAGTSLVIDSGTTDALGNSATLSLSNSALLNLGAGVNERVGFLSLDTAFQPSTTYGSSQSNAVVKLDIYFSGTGVLTVGPAILAGDYNNDGIVDAADYVIWRKNVGQPSQTLPNDITGVLIGDAQYNQWRSNFGGTTAIPGSGSALNSEAVPEPSTLAMLLFGLTALSMIRTFHGSNQFSQYSSRR